MKFLEYDIADKNFLRYVLDQWYEILIRRACKGAVYYVQGDEGRLRLSGIYVLQHKDQGGKYRLGVRTSIIVSVLNSSLLRQLRFTSKGCAFPDFSFPVSIVSKVVLEYGNILTTENQQARIIVVIEVKSGVNLHKT